MVTSAGDELARRRLEWAGLPVPDCLITADEVSEGKPSPNGYLRASEELGVAPDDCVVVEDSPAGIVAARAARMRVIGLSTTHAVSELPATDAVLPDLRALDAELGKDQSVLRLNL